MSAARPAAPAQPVSHRPVTGAVFNPFERITS
jgi:hypothetical protein